MQLRLTGFPPIELSQIIELKYGISGQEHPLKKFQGMIKDIQVESGQTAWEGTTDILLDCQTENDAAGSFSSGTKSSAASRRGPHGTWTCFKRFVQFVLENSKPRTLRLNSSCFFS